MSNTKTDVFIFDIDGTLANHKGIRGPFDEHKVHLDIPINPVWKVLKSLMKDYKIIFVSGRTDGCFSATHEWLDKHLREKDQQGPIAIWLYMRKNGDMRKDSIVKKEIYDQHIFPNHNIIGVFDDRLQVLRMLWENNIFTFSVNQGNIEF